MSNVKRLKKGERLYSEGDPVTSVFIVQTGRVNLFIDRGDRRLDLDQISTAQVLGEQSVFSSVKQTNHAEAATEVAYLELPTAVVKAQLEKAPPAVKLFTKALAEEVRRARNTIRSLRLDQDASPCPQRSIPRLFSIVALVADHVGKNPAPPKTGNFVPGPQKVEEPQNERFKDDDLIVSWNVLKIYTSRMFLESPQRMQTALDLLAKLGHVTLSFQKNEETEELELFEIRIHNIQLIEDFAEFYQHNYYKGGRAEVIYVDKLAFQIAEAFVEISRLVEPDRQGTVELPYDQLLRVLKEDYDIELKDTHLNAMEKKGLFVRRRARDEGVYLSFDKLEFQRLHLFWQIIREIDKWNEKGMVDMSEDIAPKRAQKRSLCPSCSAPYVDEQKFCSQCGTSLKAA